MIDYMCEENESLYIAKRMTQHYVVRGIFYKYVFKCIENEKINIIFFLSLITKRKAFENIINESEFKELFGQFINQIKISKDEFILTFKNGSYIRLVRAGDNARGHKCHYAVIDSTIQKDIIDNTVYPCVISSKMLREEKNLKDNIFIDYIEV